MIEPYTITNPYGKYYKFLFLGCRDEAALNRAEDYVRGWAGKIGLVIDRQRQRIIPRHDMVQISVWLKRA